jgi:hypothetical protein
MRARPCGRLDRAATLPLKVRTPIRALAGLQCRLCSHCRERIRRVSTTALGEPSSRPVHYRGQAEQFRRLAEMEAQPRAPAPACSKSPTSISSLPTLDRENRALDCPARERGTTTA